MSLRALSLVSCCLLALIFVGRGLLQAVSPPIQASGTSVRRAYQPKPAVQLALSNVWPGRSDRVRLRELGKGKGIVFSPDLSEPGNREFYQALGFAYFEDPSWLRVIDQIKAHNRSQSTDRVEALFIQSHGTNGDALKLQTGKDPEAQRSYISLGALQERLADTAVRVCLLAACNAGRLSRPETYLTVSPEPGNRLFEPATLGIVNASSDFDPSRSAIVIGRRAESHIEVVNEWRVSELSPAARAAFADNGGGPRLQPTTRIAVPEMLIQLLLQDDKLHLLSAGYEADRSRQETNDNEREKLINRFLQFLNARAVAEHALFSGSDQKR